MNEINSILNKFETISLEEMEEVKLMNRVETKFVFQSNQLSKLLESLLSDYRVAKIENNLILSYESLYFDDKNHFFYREHHRGRKNRFKVRYRRYVDSNLLFFEVKHKKKGRTNKSRVQVESQDTALGLNEKKLLEETAVPALDLIPSLSNSYKRITLVNKKSIERVTLDIALQFNVGNQHKEIPDIVIAELKQERITRTSPFYSVARKMRLKPFKISKYCTGLIQLDKTKSLKYNRFKKKLLQLNKISNYGVNLV